VTGRDVVIFGAGDFARTAYAYLSKDSPYRVAAFTVHEAYRRERALLGLDVVPFERVKELFPPGECRMFVAVGYSDMNRGRARVCGEAKERGYELITYVNSRAVQWGHVEIGENCFVLENSIIQPFVTLGNGVVVWSGAFIGHDSRVGDHCFVAPQATIAGNVTVGEFSFIGANATIRDGITIAPECLIGAGALITKDTVAGAAYAAAAATRASRDARALMGRKPS
jgi:sugar O-acyltransferase (sialic acid O-acetyltransferase NeuD family)